MKSKYFFCAAPFILLSIFLVSCNNNQSHKTEADTVSSKESSNAVPNKLLIPEGWTTEQIKFPIDFAPQINYKGSEELRFAKGWEDIVSEEHWAYAFLWTLDGSPIINDSTLQQNLTDYYSGLVKTNITSRSISSFKVVPTIVKVQSITTETGDTATFHATVNMLDYIAQKPIVLNVAIHLKNCSEPGTTKILFEVSPQPATHKIWTTLNSLNNSICL